MALDWIRLLIGVAGTLLLGVVGLYGSSSAWERATLGGLLGGLLLYNGIGASYQSVPQYYVLYYLGFCLALVVAFRVFALLSIGWSRRVQTALESVLRDLDRSSAWRMIVWIYLLLHLVPLVYPEFRLHYLVMPPEPDLTALFAARWVEVDGSLIASFVHYSTLLLAPFFYVALYRYRNDVGKQLLIMGSLLYIQYVESAYIGRGAVLTTAAIVWLSAWIGGSVSRKRLIGIAAMSLPILMVASNLYGAYRIGGTVGDFSVSRAAAATIQSETSFPERVGVPTIEGDSRVDLAEYAAWIITLPLPKALTGDVVGARVNYEISEIVLSRTRGSRGYYVVLPGLVAESVYLYGRDFFWLHAVFIAGLAVTVVRTLERSPQLLFLAAYVAILLAYDLNRAGIAAVLPKLVNGFLLFALFVFVSIHRRSRTIPG